MAVFEVSLAAARDAASAQQRITQDQPRSETFVVIVIKPAIMNLLPFLTDKTAAPPHDALFWRYGGQFAVRRGDWKLTRALDHTVTPPALKTGLFNLRDDVSEQRDLFAREPAKAKELRALWEKWTAQNVKALWGGDSPEGEASGSGRKSGKQ